MDIVDMIKDCAIEVYRELGPGHREKVYQRAMSIEFDARSILHRTEYKCDVLHKNHIVGSQRLDFLVLHGAGVVVELKAIGQINERSKGQLKKLYAYLKD